MRRFGSTLALLVAALGFGAYLYFIDAKKPLEDETAKTKVFSFDASKIDQVEIKSATGDLTSLKKDANGWTMLKPVQASADQNNAADVAATLATLEQTRIVEESATDLTPYGLASPRIDVTFNVAGEKDPKRIQFGDKNPTGVGLYAKLPGNARVFLVPNTVDTSLNRSTFDLRDKTALKIETDKVDSVELVSKNQTIRIVKSGDDWNLAQPTPAPADYTSVEGLIGQLQSAQMTSMKDAPEDLKDLRGYGLDKPRTVVTLGAGGAKVVLELGADADNGAVWARDPSRAPVFTLGNGLAEELRKTPFDFRRKEIFAFRPFNATRFEVTRGKDTRTFERVKGASPDAPDTWKQVAPVTKTVDASNFEGVLLEFSSLRAESAVDSIGSTGLANPAVVISVKFDDGKKDERVTIGRNGGDVFAARPDQPGGLKLDPAKFDGALKKLDAIQ